jgi:hypothetical protein
MLRLLMTFVLATTALIGTSAFAEDAASGTAPAPMGPGGPTGRSKPHTAAAKPAPAPSGIQLARKTPVAGGVNVHDKVLSECNIETMLPQMIAEHNSEVKLVDSAGGTHLELKIVDIHAPNGGLFSGPKWITVEGKLVSGKTVKGDFTAKQSSMASATACGMLSKVMVVMAGDIATWLNNPSKGARLGTAR